MGICIKALAELMTVVITGNVTFSAMEASPANSDMKISKGDPMTLSFNVDKEALVRVIPGQGTVLDGISPYDVCTEDFSLTFGEKGPTPTLAPPDLLSPIPPLFFGLAKGRPVNDGAWLSSAGDLGSAGVALAIDGMPPKQTFTGVFDLKFERGTVKSTDVSAAAGTYTSKGLVESQLKIARNWMNNEIVSVALDKMVISPAKKHNKVPAPPPPPSPLSPAPLLSPPVVAAAVPGADPAAPDPADPADPAAPPA